MAQSGAAGAGRPTAIVLFTDLAGSTELRSSESTHSRIGAPAWLAQTRLEWARMLLIRGEPGDDERARGLLDQALAIARELGLGGIERRAVEVLKAL